MRTFQRLLFVLKRYIYRYIICMAVLLKCENRASLHAVLYK